MTHTVIDVKSHLQTLYASHFGEADAAFFASAPGRVELAGNHTDHQGGRTISSAITQRAYAFAAQNHTNEIHIYMDGFGESTLLTSDLDMREDEKGTPTSLIRGMLAAFAQAGNPICGFNMVTYSDIPIGQGLSSSAAFEVLVGTVIRALHDQTLEGAPSDPTTLALESVWTERTYFGKPCGAQDQLASAHGGILAMDFSADEPQITPVNFDIGAQPYSLCLIDSRCDHSQFTDEYAAVPADMHAVAHYFEREKLEDISYSLFLSRLSTLRAEFGDRAVLRALHYFEETHRVFLQLASLQENNFDTFLEYVRLSGASSAQFLQNVTPYTDELNRSQPAMVILALCAHLLDSVDPRGAYRIHGGGFGGSVLAFVPTALSDHFRTSMNAFLGYDACLFVTPDARGAYVERVRQ